MIKLMCLWNTICRRVEFEFIGVLRHMQRYLNFQSYMWRHRCAGGLKKFYGRAPNAIDISQGSLTCLFYTDTGPPFLYGDSDTPPHFVAFYDTLEIRRTYSRFKPPGVLKGAICRRQQCTKIVLTILSWSKSPLKDKKEVLRYVRGLNLVKSRRSKKFNQ